jgi:hypothetical protein
VKRFHWPETRRKFQKALSEAGRVLGCVAKKKLICYSEEKRAKEVSSMSNQSLNPFKWRHFQVDIILLCVRWYLRYSLSSRDLEEIMLERGLHVDHTGSLAFFFS